MAYIAKVEDIRKRSTRPVPMFKRPVEDFERPMVGLVEETPKPDRFLKTLALIAGLLFMGWLVLGLTLGWYA